MAEILNYMKVCLIHIKENWISSGIFNKMHSDIPLPRSPPIGLWGSWDLSYFLSLIENIMSAIFPFLHDVMSLIEHEGNWVIFKDMKLQICECLKTCDLEILNFRAICSKNTKVVSEKWMIAYVYYQDCNENRLSLASGRLCSILHYWICTIKLCASGWWCFSYMTAMSSFLQ